MFVSSREVCFFYRSLCLFHLEKFVSSTEVCVCFIYRSLFLLQKFVFVSSREVPLVRVTRQNQPTIPSCRRQPTTERHCWMATTMKKTVLPPSSKHLTRGAETHLLKRRHHKCLNHRHNQRFLKKWVRTLYT